jgi:hypothetical protein
MSNVTVTEIATASLSGGPTLPAAQPTPQQAARFEQQMNLPGTEAPLYYGQAPAGSAGLDGNWRVMMDDMGKLSEQYRTDSAALDRVLSGTGSTASVAGPGQDPSARAETFEKTMSQVVHMSYTMMNVSLIGSAERLAGENVRTLYQLT